MSYLGIDVGGTTIKGAVVEKDGTVGRRAVLDTDTARGAEGVIDTIAAIINELAEGTDVQGVGIGLPGMTDDREGILRYAPNLYMHDADLRTILKERTGFSVRLINDANAAALGEAVKGAAAGAESAVIVTLGTGVGGGVVIDGKVLTGLGPASEIGHMVIRAGGRRCGCGRKGCFEAYASATGLIRTAEEAAADHPDSLLAKLQAQNGRLDGRLVFRAVDEGDETAAEVEEKYLDDLAEGLANIVAVFFPDVIALSGGIANRGEALLEPLRKKVSAISYGEQYATRHTRIVNCTLGYDAGIIGAALYAKD